VYLLLQEVHRCQDIINKVKSMREGQLGTATVTVMDQVEFEEGRRVGVE